MRDEDYLIGTYRTHGHAIARGTDPKRVMAELFGRVDGTSGGRGGSMHIFDGERRFMGGYGIVGGNLPIAAGLALASDYKGEDAVTVCMFGDGASNTGNFGETMNLAALWKLPVVFLVENNLYGMGTSVERHSAVRPTSRRRPRATASPASGSTAWTCSRCARRVAEHIRLAREERRPTLIEAFTYRYRGHSAADPEVYREQGGGRGVAREGPDRDLRRALHRGRACSASARLRGGARAGRGARSLAAVEFADASPEPPLDTLYDNLYVLGEPGPAGTRSTSAAPSRTAGEREGEELTGEAQRAGRGGRRLRRPGRRRTAGRPRRRGRSRTARRPTRSRTARSSSTRTTRARPRRPLMATLRMREALRDAMAEEMRRDESRLRDGRGRRRLPGRLQGHRGPARRVRRAAGARHADLREHDRRHRASARRWPGCGRSSS